MSDDKRSDANDYRRTHDGSDDGSHAKSNRTEAEVRRGWWPGWIWAIPIAVLLVVGWLGIRALTSGGEDITIAFSDAHGVKPENTNVMYRGLKIGAVSGVRLNDKGDAVIVTASIDESATKFLRTGTRFWLRGANPSLSNLSSLGALLSGPTIVMNPGGGKHTTHFTGLAHKPLISGPQGTPQTYEVSFDGATGALKSGDPVTLRGFTVGKIKDVGFRFDSATGRIATPVTLQLYPGPFGIKSGDMNAMIAGLIQKGLRARLEKDPPLIGAPAVTLAMVPGASDVSPKLVDGVPQIPVAPGGGLNSILSRLNKVPVDQIAQNVLDITHRVDKLVHSPKLSDSIDQLDAALKQIHQTTAKAGPKIDKLISDLRNTAHQLDDAAKSADKVMGGATTQNGLKKTMREITEAARSVRELANYLDRHPEALVKGRSGG